MSWAGPLPGGEARRARARPPDPHALPARPLLRGRLLDARARAADRASCPLATWDMGDPFTNLQEGLLRRRAADREAPEPEPAGAGGHRRPAHRVLPRASELHVEWPMGFGGVSPHAVAETLKQVRRITRRGITINTFMLDDAPELVGFVERMTEINRGRAFFTLAEPARLLPDGRLPRRAGGRRGADGEPAPAWRGGLAANARALRRGASRRARRAAAQAPVLAAPAADVAGARAAARAVPRAGAAPALLGVLERARRARAQRSARRTACVRALRGRAGAARARAQRCAARSRRCARAGKPVARLGRAPRRAEELLAGERRRRGCCVPEAGSVAPGRACATRAFFLRDLLERLGVRARGRAHRRLKTAGEALTREHVRRAARAARGAARRSLRRARRRDRRGPRPRAGARARARRRRRRSPRRARAARRGSSTAACYPDELDLVRELAPALAGDRAAAARGRRARDLPRAARAPTPAGAPLARERGALAYVVARGTIARGRGRARRRVRQRTARLFDRLAKDDGDRGVVLRIDSPGGDALASDLLWRAVRQLAREKPVVASLGDVAASGGYYLASAAHARSSRRPATLTGSIGVVGGKLDLSRALRAHRHRARRRRARRARGPALRGARASRPTSASAVRDEHATRSTSASSRASPRAARSTRERVRAVGARARLERRARARRAGSSTRSAGRSRRSREARRRAGLAPERARVPLDARAAPAALRRCCAPGCCFAARSDG